MAADSSRSPVTAGSSVVPATARVSFTPVEGAKELFTPQFVEYLAFLHERFTHTIHRLRQQRAEVLQRALHDGVLPPYSPRTEITTGEWHVPPVPDELKKPGIEISGPASITGMFINGLNPGPDGARAEGDLDDDEDSAGDRVEDTGWAGWDSTKKGERTPRYADPEKGREYRLE